MELIQKLLNLIFEFFEMRRQNKIEKEESRRVMQEQQIKTREELNTRKKETTKTGTEENFFDD